MVEFKYSDFVSRNIGIITSEEQEKLRKKVIAVAGLGSEGSMISLCLAGLGVSTFILADPDTVEVANVGRQAFCIDSIGKNKAVEMSRNLAKINPEVETFVFANGLEQNNVKEFTRKADVVIDAIDITKPDISITLNDVARKTGITTFAGVSAGFGAFLFAFDPTGISMQQFLVRGELSWIPEIPEYIDSKILDKIISGSLPAPVIAPGVMAMTSLAVTDVIMFLLGKREPVYLPRYKHLDLFSMKIEVGKLS